MRSVEALANADGIQCRPFMYPVHCVVFPKHPGLEQTMQITRATSYHPLSSASLTHSYGTIKGRPTCVFAIRKPTELIWSASTT